ncbi:Phosphate transporter PHO1-like protein [Vigna angularis]|uniref:Phosphate transporter PHO1-like protein n=1 Tax=Phaseolus angularis TaxID=3914 RepID=A0A8T0JQ24_PHAAN|nr:Phosphate transporter PHO1-like protein [Vigna angularis]
MVPEWEKEYMDYEGLKRILKEMKSSRQTKHNRSLQHRLKLERAFSGLHLKGSNQQREEDNEEQVIEVKTLEEEGGSKQLYKTNFHKLHEEGGEAEARLFQKLDEELNKVNAFYKDQVEAANHEFNLLSKQVEALVALRVKVKSPDAELKQIVSSPKETADQNHQQKDSMIGPEVDPVQQTNRNIHHHEEQAEAHNNYNRRDPLEILEHVKVDDSLQFPKSTIKKAFTDSSDNELSISKEELKKIEKQLRLVFVEFYQKLLHLKDYSFMNLSAFSKIMKTYEKVNFLLEKVESTFIRNFTRSNHKKGRKLLRQKAKTEKQNITFFTGFFSGCFVALLVATIFRITSQQFIKKKKGTFYMENIFPLYRAGTELDYREIFLLTSGHAVVALLCFLINLQIEMNSRSQQYKTVTELVPLILVVLVLLITFCPLNIIYRSSRFFFIRCLFRCICAPVFTVRLADFFLADQLTSQFQAFKSVELYICYYGLGEHSRRQKKCHTRGIYNIQYFIVGIIPYWFRLAQVVDVVLRISWMQLVFEMNWSPLRKVTIITVTSCLEIVRRGIWNFFRLENEHLNNVGNYRAFKSVPHPFSYYDEEKDKDE